MNTEDIFSSFPSGISAERTLSFQYNPDNRLWFSFVQVSIFYGHLFSDYFANQVASVKILVAMAPKVVAAWRVVCSQVATTGICSDEGLTFGMSALLPLHGGNLTLIKINGLIPNVSATTGVAESYNTWIFAPQHHELCATLFVCEANIYMWFLEIERKSKHKKNSRQCFSKISLPFEWNQTNNLPTL